MKILHACLNLRRSMARCQYDFYITTIFNQAQTIKPKSQLVDAGRSSGEPMRAQHLVIDFTPRREDTPEIQARCQQFWQFAKKQPELQGMMVQPVSIKCLCQNPHYSFFYL